jgi:tetratricopeptide (TPR) repeat protein
MHVFVGFTGRNLFFVQGRIEMFGFLKRGKPAGELDRLSQHLQETPDDTECRMRFADLCLQTGDQSTAIKQYRIAAKQLAAAGLSFESIGIYRRILTLIDVFLTGQYRASLEKAEQLLAEAQNAYEVAFDVWSPDEEPHEESKADGKGESSTKSDVDGTEGHDEIEVESVDGFEALLMDEGEKPTAYHEKCGGGSPDDEPSFSESHNGSTLQRVETQSQADIQKEDEKAETWEELAPFDLEENREPSPSGIQMDDDLEAIFLDPLSRPHSGPRETGGSHSELIDQNPVGPRLHHLEVPIISETKKSAGAHDEDDPELYYDLGVGYYEMDLIDEAIEAFTRAENQAVRRAESLFMLAKCCEKKGLFRDAAGFIDRALGLHELTQDQTSMLKELRKEIETRMSQPKDTIAVDSPR